MKSKLILVIHFFFVFAIAVHSQNIQSQLGISYSSFGANDMIYFQQLDGAGSYQSDYFYTLGIHYLQNFNTKWSIESGLEYSFHKIAVKPNVYPYMHDTAIVAHFSLISIPITLRLNLTKYFFVNGGLFLDMNTRIMRDIDTQTGMGGMLGLGFGYDLQCGISTFVNPYLKVHSLLPFFSDNHPLRLLETGFRFGIMYRLR